MTIARKLETARLLARMSPRELSRKRIADVQRVLANYSRKLSETDSPLLVGLSMAVLASIDVRDIKGMSSESFVEQMEYVLDLLKDRPNGHILSRSRIDGDILVVTSCMSDQPFLVSALHALMASERLDVRTTINAVTNVQRDSSGQLIGFGSGSFESIIRMEIKVEDDNIPPGLDQKIEQRLKMAKVMVGDFEEMKRRIAIVADDLHLTASRESTERSSMLREIEGLLRWLCDENYVLFSVEEYDTKGEVTTALGTSSLVVPKRDKELLISAVTENKRFVHYMRSVEESPVHRAGKPGHFIMPRFDRNGVPIGTCVIDGLFTYKALHTPPEEIPSLRVALREMLSDRNVSTESHRGKSITNAFNSLPLEYLVSETREHIWELTDRVLRAEEEGGSDVHIKIGDDRRFAFVFVALPRWQFSEDLRVEVQRLLLSEFSANYTDYGVYFDRNENAIVHFYISGPDALPEVDVESLREKVLGHAKSWNERLRDALGELVGKDSAFIDELYEIYTQAFNEEHMRRAGGERLVADLRCLERIRAGQVFDCDLFSSLTGDHPGSLNLRVFTRDPLTLSMQLPVISGFGFEVIDEYHREVRLPFMSPVGMHTFRLNVRPEQQGHVLARRESILHAIADVFAHRIGDDALNRLVVSTGLSGQDVEIVRAYVDYLHQLGSPFSTELVRQVLTHQPSVASSMIALLSAKFDPDPDRRGDLAVAEQTLTAELQSVTDYSSDRVLQLVAEVVRATIRTNAFVANRRKGQAFAFKLDTSVISFGPKPKPFREIWVHHPDFRGVHLRGGKVARGGLRFSDRPDDFRTEIHGLMATQMVKNVLIVPVGAKGGFVLCNPPSDPKQLRRAGDETYKLFIEALLSITDNVIDGTVASPTGIVPADDSDPYLVVAADKGTAHLSDTANDISASHRFWLDDAFASGGSNGYDHKATGITARGAWEVTKRSFYELGIDPENDPITVVGVGDMSGDVFGNGLLRSKTVRLLAAFNHMHIFIDPDPDALISYGERKRLFEMPGSHWTDYDPKLLSPGGGVWERKSKIVELTQEARKLLGVAPDAIMSGDAVVRALLRLPVDLFWMGGIGTYVKSRDESNNEVGDKTNDSIRIDAKELACKVFAEGANLSITDGGRAEFSKSGGQNYTAFLDNSGGVDLSDHEVNFKILFAPLIASGEVSLEQRNQTLRDVEEEACEMVLANNRSQSRMVSYDSFRSLVDPWRYSRTQKHLASAVPFDPESFSLPSADDMANRFRRHQGLFKCESAVLSAHAKMFVSRELIADDPLPEMIVDEFVTSYFPKRVRDLAGKCMKDHLLRREIATTLVVNRIVDNAGSSFFSELQSITGRKVRDIALCYLGASKLSGVDSILDSLYRLEDKTRQWGIYRAMATAQAALEDATFYLLGPYSIPLWGKTMEHGQEILENLPELLPEGQKSNLNAKADRLEEVGLPSELAGKIAALMHLLSVLDSLHIASLTGRDVEATLRVRLAVSTVLRISELRDAIAHITLQSPWDGPAVNFLGRQLDVHIHKIVRQIEAGDDVHDAIETLGLGGVREQIGNLLDAGELTIAALVMLDGQLRRLLPQTGAS